MALTCEGILAVLVCGGAMQVGHVVLLCHRIDSRAATLTRVVAELLPDAAHNTEQYANNRVENDHGRLKTRLRPMRGLKRDRTASVVIRGHAFIQNLRCGHYELGVDARDHHLRVAAVFDELAKAI